MKRSIKNILLWILFPLLGLQGCSFLDIDTPDNLVKDDYWKNREQLYAALMGVYTSLSENVTQFIKWGDLRAEIYSPGTKSKAEDMQFINQDIYTTNVLVDWNKVYKGINWTNSFLKNARLTMSNDPSLTLAEVQGMESEAYAIRALYYFYLVRTFRDVPVSMEAYESDTQQPYGPALSEQQVLDTIEQDLQRAYLNVSESFENPEEKYGRITLNAVRAIWADVKLWRGDYAGCLKLCSELESEYEHQLLPSVAWYTMFSIGNASESIFEYQYVQNGPSSPLWGLFYSGSENVFMLNARAYLAEVGMILPARAEGHLFGDTIRTQLAGVNIASAESEIGEVYKYLGVNAYKMEYRSVDKRNTINFIFYRYREILLMKAEALAIQGDYSGAEAAVNVIRQATEAPIIEPGDFGEGSTFFDNLLNERIVELCFEGKQWFSMLRMARNTGFNDLVIERIAQYRPNGNKLQTMRARLQDPESWFLPYSNTEVEQNTLLNQKSYYEGKN